MSEFFRTRAEQDGAVEQMLLGIGASIKRYSMDFWNEIDGTGHEVDAAVAQDFVDVWVTGTSMYIRVSTAGAHWLNGRIGLT